MCEFSRTPSSTQCPAAVAGGDHLTSSLVLDFSSLIFEEFEMQHAEGGCLGCLGTAPLVAQRSRSAAQLGTVRAPKHKPQALPAGEQWDLKVLVLCRV